MSTSSITFISAGAGSGKTTRLTDILGEKLLRKEAKPDGIIATTFTNKAAAELRERTGAMLLEKNRQDLAVSILDAQIGTVNSVCGGLLRRFAFELGLTIEQKVLDEHAAMERLSEALDNAVGPEALAAVTALAERLGHVDARKGAPLWKEHVRAVIDLARYNNIDPARFGEFSRKNADELLALFPEPGERLEERVLAEIAGLKPVIEKDLAAKPLNNTRNYLDRLRQFENSLSTGSFVWKDWLGMAKAAPRKALETETATLDNLCRRVDTHPGLHGDIRDYLALVFDIAGKALGIYQEQKRRKGFVDFADQEALLLDGLDNPSVRTQLREKLDLLLVDEFQDTSPIQLALFLKLSRLARRTYWVGDVKQAIYGFRGGDAQLMQAVLDFLPQDSRELLDRSWRSVPSLVHAVNAVFGETFSPEMAAEEIALQPEREEHPSQASCLHWNLGNGALEKQYRATAQGIHRLLRERYEVFDKQEKTWRDARYSDIAILAATNAHVQKIASALKESGIPAATEQPGLLASPESVLVIAALRRLVDPSDTLASAELYSLATCSEPEEWIRSRLEHLRTDHDPDRWLEEGDGAHPLLRKIARLRERITELSPAGALESLVAITSAARRVLAWCRDTETARMRLLNIRALVELAGEYEQECATRGDSATLRGLIHRFSSLADSEEDLFPEPPVNAVRVLTFHKSKGLEWPVVILLDLDRKIRTDISAPTAESLQGIDAASPLKDRFIRFWPSPFGSARPFADMESVAQSAVMQNARVLSGNESARLLYVAMTRARDCLILGASLKSKSFPWLEQAGADSFLHGAGDGAELPGGARFSSARWDGLDEEMPQHPAEKERARLYWYAPREPAPEHLPEQVSPSLREAAPGASVVETITYGGTIDLYGERPPTEKGTVVHDILAFGLTQEPGICDAVSVGRLLGQHDAAGLCEPEALARQLGVFRQTLAERWPDGKLHVEVPVEQVLPREQVLKGQIDLLLETPEGWVIIDHKITELGPEQREAKAMTYSGQLHDYRNALEEVTGKPVTSCWIHFFTAGELVRLDV